MVEIKGINLPHDLYYTDQHLWVKLEDGKARIGMDDMGQKLAGRIVFIRFVGVGKEVKKGEYFGSLESGKWVGRLASPVGGTIAEVNNELKTNARLVNNHPYGYGWLMLVKPSSQEKLREDLGTLVHGASVKPWLEKEIEKYKSKLSI